LSSSTHDLDNRAVASAVSDAVKSSIDLQAGVKNRIELAMVSQEINLDDEMLKMRKKGFSKELVTSVRGTFDSQLPVELLPQIKNKWRLSNAMSLIANSTEILPDARLDLQKAAMEVL